MSETHFCGALILAITFLLIIRYSLRKKNSFLNIREIVCDYWKMLSSLRHRVMSGNFNFAGVIICHIRCNRQWK